MTTTTSTATVGDRVEVLGRYSMDVRAVVADEWTGLFGEVVEVYGVDALVELEGSGVEVWLNVSRIEARSR